MVSCECFFDESSEDFERGGSARDSDRFARPAPPFVRAVTVVLVAASFVPAEKNRLGPNALTGLSASVLIEPLP